MGSLPSPLPTPILLPHTSTQHNLPWPISPPATTPLVRKHTAENMFWTPNHNRKHWSACSQYPRWAGRNHFKGKKVDRWEFPPQPPLKPQIDYRRGIFTSPLPKIQYQRGTTNTPPPSKECVVHGSTGSNVHVWRSKTSKIHLVSYLVGVDLSYFVSQTYMPLTWVNNTNLPFLTLPVKNAENSGRSLFREGLWWGKDMWWGKN